ncbi:hypothetical protein BK727_02435 [Bacillus thuringiensis serovar roskildiensis]|uniref:Uncharacterized protein n=4 Tax=Bacillus cereus group TaxID=86661 RepID=A0A9Q5X5E3_BACTU|nr:hypothetical protein BK707_08645 [Bacillus thuringiensis serovar coreanensis]OTX55598.1 hypothetical protein BK724_03295 [Bacillus thuringiensis serovar sooncheon]OTX58936.1 hypothetical protein BK725_04505 [Bacillus thuringiensis serovar guiyangiensis]OTX72432.1 hypothetical protein BK727_02435 [Bacillus thuringiensis serovar roskildiensis]
MKAPFIVTISYKTKTFYNNNRMYLKRKKLIIPNKCYIMINREGIKMLDQITWGTPGSLLCLGFFFAGLGIFLRSMTSYSKNK